VTERTKITLDESEIPRQWYNMIPDLPAPPPPPLHPGTLQPAGLEDLTPLFPMGLIGQEVATDSFIDIPAEVLDVCRPAGVLQRGRGHQAAHHRDRRRAVGQRAGVRVRAVRHRLRDLDGPCLL
jgi:hypothetical protein